MSEEERPESEAGSVYEDAVGVRVETEEEQFMEASELFLQEIHTTDFQGNQGTSELNLPEENDSAEECRNLDMDTEGPSTSFSTNSQVNTAPFSDNSPQPGTSNSSQTGFHSDFVNVPEQSLFPSPDLDLDVTGAAGPLLGDEDDDDDDDEVLLLQVNEEELETLDNDVQPRNLDHTYNQFAMVSAVAAGAQVPAENEENHDVIASGSSHSNGDIPVEEHRHDNRDENREEDVADIMNNHGNQEDGELNFEEDEAHGMLGHGNGDEDVANIVENHGNQGNQENHGNQENLENHGNQENLEINLEEDEAQRMLDALMDIINNHEDILPFGNLIGAVNMHNMDDYLSLWHVQQEHQHHHDNVSNQQQVARDELAAAQNDVRNEVVNNQQQVARIPGIDVDEEVQFPFHPDNQNHNLVIVVQNNMQHRNDVINDHDDLVVDVREDANRRVIVRQNNVDIGNHDVRMDQGEIRLNHHDNEELIDLEQIFDRDGAVVLPRLDLDAAFDADAEDSNDAPVIVADEMVIVHNEDDPVAMVAVPVAMDRDDASSTASSSPRRSRERRRKKKKKVEEKFVPPPGDETVGLKWANDLPEIVLIQIYSLMRDSDRVSMSRVCHYWSDIFCSARLWRERSYRFAGVYTNIKLGEKAISFAKKHSNHLKILTITCEHPTYLSVKRFQRTMTTFFNLLLRRHAPCRLNELYMTSLAIERYWRYEGTRHKFLVSLSRFLGSQNKLKVFDMTDALFSAADGFKVIEALGRGAKNSLLMLNIEDFFQARLSLVSSDRWVELLTRFRRLSSVYLNYNWISEPLLLALSQSTQGRLKLLSVKVLKNDPHHHKIDSVTWHTVRKLCPHLRVHFYTEGLGSHGDFRNLLVPEMPLRSLQIWTGLHRNQEGPWHLPHTFTFLADCFTQQLEELSICCENDNEFIDDAVMYMVKKAARLRYLDIQGVMLTDLVENICNLQQQQKIGLQRCHLILENLTGVDVQELECIVDRYEPMIAERKLDFNFQPNQMPFF